MSKVKTFEDDKFEAAKSWYAEKNEMLEIMANRWFVAFIVALILCVALVSAIVVMMPLKKAEPFLIKVNTLTGESWVDKPTTQYAPVNQAQAEQDIVGYITQRESYNSADLNERFETVREMSDSRVAADYVDSQENSNKTAPVNLLGEKGTRTVHIEDVYFIDKEGTQEIREFRQKSTNLAKVDFSTTTTDANGAKSTQEWVATIGWVYKGLPDTKELAWKNPNGFTVTTYRVDQKSVAPTT